MTFDASHHANPVPAGRGRRALVLMGGGARTAYQVGVLRALAALLRLQPAAGHGFPFEVVVGTSAGALNGAVLASHATRGLEAMDALAALWAGELRSDAVYRLRAPGWVRLNRVLATLALWRQARRHAAVLDTMPLVDTLHRAVSLPGIDAALQAGALQVLAVTASSYTTGVHWTFCHTARAAGWRAWDRPGRRAEFQPLTIEHLMASSAIPFLFPATPLWVDGRREYFGDGSIRQVSPLSPALHLGADRVLVVGVGQSGRAGMAGGAPPGAPGLGAIAGHALASVFHDTLRADVEQAQRVTQTLRRLPPEVAAALPYRPVRVLALQPTQSLDALAAAHVGQLPASARRVLAGLGALRGGGGALASYLLFEPGFVGALMALGEQDAYARKGELLSFFE